MEISNRKSPSVSEKWSMRNNHCGRLLLRVGWLGELPDGPVPDREGGVIQVILWCPRGLTDHELDEEHQRREWDPRGGQATCTTQGTHWSMNKTSKIVQTTLSISIRYISLFILSLCQKLHAFTSTIRRQIVPWSNSIHSRYVKHQIILMA